MNDKSSNSMNMIRATVQFCDNNTASTAGITMFPTILTTVKNKVTLIDQLEQTVLTNTTGVTLDTNTLRRAMSTVAMICTDAVTAYASSVNNNTLKEQVNYTPSMLTKLKKEEAVDVCQIIHDAANTNIANAQNFGITPTDVTDLQSAIDLYRARLQNPRQAVVNKNVANKQIKTLIFEIKNQYFKLLLDKMVATLQNTNPTFVQQYKSVREIIDLGSNSPTPPTQ